MKTVIQRPKGTADVSPSRVHVWHTAESTVRDIAARFGYREIRVPTFEHTELFIRGVGDTTDVVQKEMYTMTDKGGRSITLRPEGTASVVRAYIENGEAQSGAPFKVYYIVPNFRYEKPQAGRLREHHQFGIECFGAPGYMADAEVIALADTMLRSFDIRAALRINSIGCPNCRPKYQQALREYFEAHRETLCDTCRERLEKNPLRILDCKSEICSKLAEGAPRTVDYLCDECTDHFAGLQEMLQRYGIEYTVDTGIVRGLDYYTKTVFEFVSTDIGAQGTICGGGRYDLLISQLGGTETAGIGFGCGLERLILAAEAAGFTFPEPERCTVFFAGADAAGQARAGELALALRRAGVRAENDICGRGLKAQLKHADRIGARCVAVLGGSELEEGRVQLKNMHTGEQSPVELTVEAIKTALER